MSWLCALPLVADLFTGCGAPAPVAVGYVEGDYVLVAPIDAASIVRVPVRRGQKVTKGELLAELVTDDAVIAPQCGQYTAECAPESTYVPIEGMGHGFSESLMLIWVGHMVSVAQRASR